MHSTATVPPTATAAGTNTKTLHSSWPSTIYGTVASGETTANGVAAASEGRHGHHGLLLDRFCSAGPGPSSVKSGSSMGKIGGINGNRRRGTLTGTTDRLEATELVPGKAGALPLHILKLEEVVEIIAGRPGMMLGGGSTCLAERW